jgi:hypothetical protein
LAVTLYVVLPAMVVVIPRASPGEIFFLSLFFLFLFLFRAAAADVPAGTITEANLLGGKRA